jgi:hypothetical protein
MIGLGGLLIQKGHVLPGCTVAIGSVLGAFGLVIYFLTLRARGIPLSSQERALAGNAQQLLSDHACSAAL